MSERESASRRKVLQLSGAVATAGLTGLAGCSGGGGDGGDGGDETTTTTAGETTTTGDGGGTAASFKLGGKVAGWQGMEPASIDGTTNPTLTLTAGETYEITWVNQDGAMHNIQLLDGDGNVLKKTETIGGEGATQTLTFEATAEMAEYNCVVHPTSMRGDLEVN